MENEHGEVKYWRNRGLYSVSGHRRMEHTAGREADVGNRRLTGSPGRHTRKPGKRPIWEAAGEEKFLVWLRNNTTAVLVNVSMTVIEHHDPKQLRKERVYFSFQLWGHSFLLIGVRAGTQGKTWSRGYKECCLLACSLWFAQSAFLCHPGPPCQLWHHPLCPGSFHINH